MPDIFTENTSHKFAIPKNSSLINYSILKEFYSPTPFRSFSIKYVVEGTELYSVNGTKYLVKSNQYLLANKFSEGFVEIDSKKSVTGICIDVAPEILSEVISNYVRPNTASIDLNLDVFFNSTSFLENKYTAQNTHVGNFLLELESLLKKNPELELKPDKDFYYSLSEKIVADHIPIFKQLQNVRSVKTETRKDLFRKVVKGKEYIDLHFTSISGIEAVAKEIGISEYYFFRLFKTIYSISPYQYIIIQRLKFAVKCLEESKASISQVAIEAGFADVFSFSKSFKKHMGFSPSGLLKNSSF